MPHATMIAHVTQRLSYSQILYKPDIGRNRARHQHIRCDGYRFLRIKCEAEKNNQGQRLFQSHEDDSLGCNKRKQIKAPLSRTLTRIKPFLADHLGIIIKAWACTLVSSVSLFLLIPETGSLSSILSNGDMQRLRSRCLYLGALLSARSVAKFFQQSLLWEAALRITYDLRRHVFKNVLQNDVSYFEGRSGIPPGDIAYRITEEAQDTGDFVYSLLETLVPSALQLIAVSGRMILLSPVLFIVTILVIPCMCIAVATLGERLRVISREGQNSIASLSSYLNEIFPSTFIVKAYAAEEFENWRFQKLALADKTARVKKKTMKAFIPEAISAFYVMTAVVYFIFATWAVYCGLFNQANMVSFMTSLVLLVDPIQTVSKSYNELKQGEPAIERLLELTHSYQNVKENQETLSLPQITGDVKFCNVTFQYNKDLLNVLTNLSFHVRAGEKVAFVGPSGGGKTTIAKLLLRLYDPTEGCILLDGHDIRKFNLKNLRKHVTIVPQQVGLLSGTVAENIAYGELSGPHAKEKIKQAAILANAHDFISMLPNGYDTELSDSASGLSGGQRQRLAIARAVYRQSSILILDEATSALDNISEKLVKEALDKCMKGRTVFMIAHRLETVQSADRIFLLKEGRLVEEGTHSSLLSKGGHYASLYATNKIAME